MKKILIPTLLAVTLLGCSKPNPTDQIVDVMTEYTAKLNNAKSSKEADKIIDDFTKEIDKIHKEHPDYKPSEEDKAKTLEAAGGLTQAMMKAALQSAGENTLTSPQPAEK